MNILVTGGAGYIGSHFVKAAVGAGHRPVVLDNLSTGHRWAVLAEDFYDADLADEAKLKDILTKERIEAVVHFAANAYVGESVENPMKYFNNNYVNTLKLLDAMLECGVRTLIFSSTCAVYGIPGSIPITEDEPKKPINPYGLTKHFIEETLKWYESAYGLNYIALRYFNAAGADPGLETGEMHDPETHLIPLVLEAAAGKREFIEIFGTDYDTPDGTCVRDYIHVLDLAVAHLLALDCLMTDGKSGTFNLGGNRGHSVREVIDVAKSITSSDIPVRQGQRRPGDPPVLVSDSTHARQTLGWNPGYEDINVIIGHAWQWMKKAGERGL
jgi:UDP-glucose 4-epimerase